MKTDDLQVPGDKAGIRIDVFLAESYGEILSRSQVKRLISEDKITVMGKSVTAHYKIKAGDLIRISRQETRDFQARAEDIPLEILYEDESLIVVNKPAGMVVHPAHGNYEHTLVNALLFHTGKLSESDDTMRPGIVHRLDKDTSGVMVAAKNDRAHRFLARQFKEHTIERVYHAVVRGVVQHEEGLCEEPVGRAFLNRRKIIIRPTGGKDARTFFRVTRRYRDASLLEVRPQTGRTHQIRVHMSFLGHPILGDALYGGTSAAISRQALHAKILGFVHPVTRERMLFETELPEDMRKTLALLETDLRQQ
ncbi:MAG: RluA family pseudouridine synthase [Candidatus Omnitrophica bacterium]|nr:RluA family pseudouridine synthase [Candidatus Omnitrophota bacterium]